MHHIYFDVMLSSTFVGFLFHELKKSEKLPMYMYMKNRKGFSYLLPKSGSRSLWNGFFLRIFGRVRTKVRNSSVQKARVECKNATAFWNETKCFANPKIQESGFSVEWGRKSETRQSKKHELSAKMRQHFETKQSALQTRKSKDFTRFHRG